MMILTLIFDWLAQKIVISFFQSALIFEILSGLFVEKQISGCALVRRGDIF